MKTDFFAGNRARLVEKLRGGLIVMTAYTAQQRRDDMSFAFEQESNFWYLTGIEHADWRLVIDGTRNKTWLIAPDIDAMHQVFDGSLDAEDAKKISGVDEVLDRVAGERLLYDLARKHSVAYTFSGPAYATHFNFALNPAPRKLLEELKRIFASVVECEKEFTTLRMIKQPVEITAMKKAIRLTCDTFDAVKSELNTLKTEYEVEAEFGYRFRRKAAEGHAYDPIVATGKNACTLHYVDNRSRLRDGQLVLIDIGARVDGYAADITRTYAYGEPSAYARRVHTAVQTAQQEIIKLIQPGVGIREYIQSVDTIMLAALCEVGLAKDMTDTESVHRYMPHAIGHGLGVDVHDPLRTTGLFEPGMVMTVEPGIYIPEKNIGVRIEDDILVTEKGRQNLSARLSTDC